jgi:hypothetical protein
VKVTVNFPEPCRFVLETLREVYGYDAVTREQGMSAEERLVFHQEHSKPVMEKLHTWLQAQFDEMLVEPNSGLGNAIHYLLKHWEKLTLFLRKAGVPLDNNIVERALKKAILHRKNSLFYKTRKGAQMGDLFMSLIHTCELNGANAFDYLMELLRHAEESSLVTRRCHPVSPFSKPEFVRRFAVCPVPICAGGPTGVPRLKSHSSYHTSPSPLRLQN